MASKLREINLEEGKPLAADAIRRLTFELQNSKRLGFSVLKIIHGYGSSGKGGRIRVEARQYLDKLLGRGEMTAYITGEQFSIFDGATRAAFTRCNELREDRDLVAHQG